MGCCPAEREEVGIRGSAAVKSRGKGKWISRRKKQRQGEEDQQLQKRHRGKKISCRKKQNQRKEDQQLQKADDLQKRKRGKGHEEIQEQMDSGSVAFAGSAAGSLFPGSRNTGKTSGNRDREFCGRRAGSDRDRKSTRLNSSH